MNLVGILAVELKSIANNWETQMAEILSKGSTESRVTPEYAAAVTKLADEHVNQRFLNDSHDHANLLSGLMIGRTKEYDDVLIYSNSLPFSCYGDALKRAGSGNIRIILEDASSAEEIKNLSTDHPDCIHYRVLDTTDGAHFWIAGSAFRLEMDHDKAKAIANFNDPEAIKILRERFEKLWAIAK